MNEYLVRSLTVKILRIMADGNSHEHTLSRTSFEGISAISWLWAVGGKAHGFHVATGWTKHLIFSIQ